MIKTILFAVLAAGGVAVTQNIFDPSEMGSGAIYTAVSTCAAQQGGPTPATLAQCGCVVDAMRFNFKARKTGGKTLTEEQIARCSEAPVSPPQRGKTGK
jgi:hypothetical protein